MENYFAYFRKKEDWTVFSISQLYEGKLLKKNYFYLWLSVKSHFSLSLSQKKKGKLY
jgi:hypothetical protein